MTVASVTGVRERQRTAVSQQEQTRDDHKPGSEAGMGGVGGHAQEVRSQAQGTHIRTSFPAQWADLFRRDMPFLKKLLEDWDVSYSIYMLEETVSPEVEMQVSFVPSDLPKIY